MTYYYSVHVLGDRAEAIAIDLRQTFKSKRADFTGHPFFYVESHRDLEDFHVTISGMVDERHEVVVREITKQVFDG